MNLRTLIPTAIGVAGLLCAGAVQELHAQATDPAPDANIGESQTLVLTPEQRRTIYESVAKDGSKTAKQQFPATVGASVPPMIELHALPDQVLAENRAANFYECTLVHNKVVLVDPTKMRVVAVIGPPGQQ